MTRDELAIRIARDHHAGVGSFETLRQKYAAHYSGRQDQPTRGWIARLKRIGDDLLALAEDAGGTAAESAAPGNVERESYRIYPESTSLRYETYTFTGLGLGRPKLPVFNGEPHVYGDCIVAGDFHLPTCDYTLADRLLQVAHTTGIRTLIIVGDLVNMDSLSSYDHLVPPLPFTVEVQVAVELLEQYAAWFDVMWLALGNHEHRLIKRLQGDIDNSILGRILSATGGKLQITPYSQIVIHSGGQVWRATHPAAYSRIKGRVGDVLAQKYQSHIIVHHQHHAGKIMDSFGRYVIIDNGGLFNSDMMAYVKLRDTTAPMMTRGFTVIRDGIGELLTPYPAYTDWRYWLPNGDLRERIA